jgi:phage terminase Nu1 subunit (DNA packaging protein)
MVKQVKKESGEVTLPSFRNGEAFTVKQLTFGGMKVVARISENEGSQIDVMEATLYETLKRTFPNVTTEEIDAMEQRDVVTLSNAIAAVNGDSEGDFTPKANTTK